MRTRKVAVVAAITFLALALVTLPVLRGQARSAPRPGIHVLPAPAAEQQECDAKARDAQVRDFDKLARELESEAQELDAQVREEEADMEPEDLARLESLQSELGGAQQDVESRSGEVAALVEALTQSQVAAYMDEDSGWLGVEIAEVAASKAKDLKLSAERGVLVVEVEPDSPAGKAGLKAEDIITEYDRQAVEGTVQFRRLVRETPPGRTIPITVWRDGSAQNLSVEIRGRRAPTAGRMHEFHENFLVPPQFDFKFDMPNFIMGEAPVLGISAEDVSGQLGTYFGAPGGEGVLVREVRSGAPAEKAGLKAGDIITRVDNETVKTVSELREQLHARREQKTVKLSVIRKGAETEVNVALEKPQPREHMRVSRRISL